MGNRITVIKPEYVFVQLKPNNSIRNNNTHLLARSISDLYRGLWSCLKWEEMKIFNLFGKEFAIGTRFSFTRQGKISYYIYMEKEKIEFYFIIPSAFYALIKERIGNVWNGITIKEVAEIPQFSKSAYKLQMVYEKEDGLSLKTDRKDNDLLNASLNVVDLMEEGDKAGIFYNFIPVSQGSFRHSYKATMEKVQKGLPTERKKTGWKYVLKMGVSLLDTIIQDIAEVVIGKKKKNEESILDSIIERLNGDKKVSESTEKKIRSQVLGTQILIFSESNERLSQRNHATSLAQSFDVLTGDNRLVKRGYKGKMEDTIEKKHVPGVEIIRVGDLEVQSFISLPGRELLERYTFMDKVETQETQVPKDLRRGTISVGESTFRGAKTKAFLSSDDEYKKLMLLLIGPQRAGKSNYISHLCVDAIENGECVVIVDFIKKCELSNDVAKCLPKDKVLVIRGDDTKTLQGIGYNEVKFVAETWTQYRNAKEQTSNTVSLINAVNPGDSSRLTPKMTRYLESACLIVYINNGPMRDVFNVLIDHELRHDYIKRVPTEQKENLSDYIHGLRELDEFNKDGLIVGTKNIQTGIIDRLNTMKQNSYMELMLKRSTENNIDLVEEMQKNQLIIIQMPQRMFMTESERDVYTTYWLTKIWMALQIRSDTVEDKNLNMVNLVIDELYQVENAEIFLTGRLAQMAKFSLKPIISCHYINQLTHMRKTLRSVNPSYMLIQGCDKDNFAELKEELYPFVLESLLNLKRYHSLNHLKCNDGYATFITALPPKIEKRIAEKKKKPLMPPDQNHVVISSNGKVSFESEKVAQTQP